MSAPAREDGDGRTPFQDGSHGQSHAVADEWMRAFLDSTMIWPAADLSDRIRMRIAEEAPSTAPRRFVAALRALQPARDWRGFVQSARAAFAPGHPLDAATGPGPHRRPRRGRHDRHRKCRCGRRRRLGSSRRSAAMWRLSERTDAGDPLVTSRGRRTDGPGPRAAPGSRRQGVRDAVGPPAEPPSNGRPAELPASKDAARPAPRGKAEGHAESPGKSGSAPRRDPRDHPRLAPNGKAKGQNEEARVRKAPPDRPSRTSQGRANGEGRPTDRNLQSRAGTPGDPDRVPRGRVSDDAPAPQERE